MASVENAVCGHIDNGYCSACVAVIKAQMKELDDEMHGEPKLKKLCIDENGVEAQIEHWGVKALAMSVLDTLLGGRDIKFASAAVFNLKTGNWAIPELEVTIKKAHGKSIEASCLENHRELRDLAAKVVACEGDPGVQIREEIAACLVKIAPIYTSKH